MTKSKPQPVAGPEGDAAYARALPILESVAAAAGMPTPQLCIVTSVSVQPGGDSTAEINFRNPQQVLLKLPVAVALEASDAGLRWLMTHELGHVATQDSPWYRRRLLLFFAVVIGLLFPLAAYVWSVVNLLVLQQEAPVSGGWVFAGIVLCLFPMAGAMYCSRQIEHGADAFAARHLDSTEGAREQFAFFDERRPSRTRLQRFLERPWSTHPSHEQRLKAMNAALERNLDMPQ
ncbi:M48 family metalloprotease [Arthrobacter monumenti]